MEILGGRLRDLRRARGLTQGQVAAALKMNQGMISFYERGEGDPSLSTLLRFAEFYAVTVGALVDATPAAGPTRAPTDKEIAEFILRKLGIPSPNGDAS